MKGNVRNLEGSTGYIQRRNDPRWWTNGEQTTDREPHGGQRTRKCMVSVYVAPPETSDYSLYASTSFAYIAILTEESEIRPQVCDVY